MHAPGRPRTPSVYSRDPARVSRTLASPRSERSRRLTPLRWLLLLRAHTPPSPPKHKNETTGRCNSAWGLASGMGRTTHQRALHVEGVLLDQVLGICAVREGYGRDGETRARETGSSGEGCSPTNADAVRACPRRQAHELVCEKRKPTTVSTSTVDVGSALAFVGQEVGRTMQPLVLLLLRGQGDGRHGAG